MENDIYAEYHSPVIVPDSGRGRGNMPKSRQGVSPLFCPLAIFSWKKNTVEKKQTNNNCLDWGAKAMREGGGTLTYQLNFVVRTAD